MSTRRLAALARSLVYASGFVALWWWVAASARRFDARLEVTPPEALRRTGIVVAVLGAALAGWCVVTFSLVGLGTPAPFDAPRQFVAKGPYRFVRNPMYVGAMAVIAGAGLIARSPSVLLVAAGFGLVMHTFVLGYEEPTLARRFGVTYDAYRKAVGRWLPRRWGSGLAAAVALAAGLAIAWIDTRPGWDDAGITAGLVVVASFAVTALGLAPWFAALLVASPVLVSELPDGFGVLLAVPFAIIGACLGAFARRLATSRMG